MLKAFHSLKHKHGEEEKEDLNKKVSGLQFSATPEELPKSLDEIFGHEDWLEQFRQHLRQRLALENLLFYEGIELYESIEESKEELLNKAGVFMLKQFIEEDSEDMINISSPLRKQLLKTEVFMNDTFTFAKYEVYNLMESNFLSSFKRDLQGAESDVSTNDSTDMDSSNESSSLSKYMKELSFEEIQKLNGVDAVKVSKFLKRGCGSACERHNPHMNKFCCERQRVFDKLMKMEKKKPCSMRTCVTQMMTKLSPVMLFGVEIETKKTGTRMFSTKKTKRSGSLIFNNKFSKHKSNTVTEKQLNL